MAEEATVDCYNEHEGFAGMLATLEDRLELPFQSKVLGETVEVIGLDEEQSSERRGVVAKVGLGEGQNTVALAGVSVMHKDTRMAEWLEQSIPTAG